VYVNVRQRTTNVLYLAPRHLTTSTDERYAELADDSDVWSEVLEDVIVVPLTSRWTRRQWSWRACSRS